MAHKIERSLCSLTAIAAASLLLSTSPVLAQSVQPPADAQAPVSAPPTAPQPDAAAATPAAPVAQAPVAQPTVTQPQAAPEPAAPAATPAPVMTTNPVVQPLPDPAQTPAPATADTATTPATSARTAAHRTTARAAPAPLASSKTEARPQGSVPPSSATQSPAPADKSGPDLARHDPAGLYTADGAPVATTTRTTSRSVVTPPSPYARYWPLEAGGAILLAGLIGYAFTRRREEDEDETMAAPTTPMEPVAATPFVAEPVRTRAPAAVAVSEPVEPLTTRDLPAASPSLTTAPSASLEQQDAPSASILPAGPVPTGAAREELLKRMVAAPPDAANPFRTVKARTRRARMILASRKQALRDRATEAFDWRTYKPSLTHVTLGEATNTATVTKTRGETVK